MIIKIGILGGTFDPVHNGHLQLAEAAGKLCHLDEVFLVPALLPPHKQGQRITPYAERVAMLELAVKNSAALTVSTVEQKLPVPSFTIDTIQHLKQTASNALDLFFIAGADTFLEILSWKKSDSVLQACNFIIFSRPGEPNGELIALMERLGFQQKTAICWVHAISNKKIYHTDIGLPNISSSTIRKQLAAGHSVTEMLPQKVEEYIKIHGLYC